MTPTRRLALALPLLLLLGPSSASAAPPDGAPPATTAAILDALGPSVDWLVGGSAVLGPGPALLARPDVRVSGDWAFVRVEPRRGDGGAIDPDAVPLGRDLVRPVTALALLIRRSGRWYLVESALASDGGAGLAPFARYRPPPGLLP